MTPHPRPWKDSTPTLEEAAIWLPKQAAFLTGERETTTPPEVVPVGTWTGSDGILTVTTWTVDAAVVRYGYYSTYREREAIVAGTLFQLTQGGLAPDGWGSFEVYRVPRALDQQEAEQVARMIVAGLPVRLGGAEL